MRIIDVDRPLNLLKDDLHVFKTMTGECEKGMSYGIRLAIDRIQCGPTISPESLRVHGMWMPFYESEITGFNPEFAGCDPIAGYKCSKCGAEAIFDCNDQFVLSHYCHNCGAKMDEEKK